MLATESGVAIQSGISRGYTTGADGHVIEQPGIVSDLTDSDPLFGEHAELVGGVEG